MKIPNKNSVPPSLMIISQPCVCSEEFACIHSFNPRDSSILQTGKGRTGGLWLRQEVAELGFAPSCLGSRAQSQSHQDELLHVSQRLLVLGTPHLPALGST